MIVEATHGSGDVGRTGSSNLSTGATLMTEERNMECAFIAGVAFLLGFKIAAYIAKRHLDRMKAIWLRLS